MVIQDVALLCRHDPLIVLLSIESFKRSSTFLLGFLSLRFLLHIFASHPIPKPTIYFPSNVPYNGCLGAPWLKQLDRQISGFKTGNCREKELLRKRHFAKDEICNKVSLSDGKSSCAPPSVLLAFPFSRSPRLEIPAMLLKRLGYFRKTLVKRSRAIST